MTERDRRANNLKSLLTLPSARMDCRDSVAANTEFVNAAPLDELRMDAPVAELSPAALEEKKKETINQGMAPVVVAGVMALHLELSPPPEREAIIKRVEGLKTIGDAVAYVEEVEQLGKAAEIAQRP